MYVGTSGLAAQAGIVLSFVIGPKPSSPPTSNPDPLYPLYIHIQRGGRGGGAEQDDGIGIMKVVLVKVSAMSTN